MLSSIAVNQGKGKHSYLINFPQKLISLGFVSLFLALMPDTKLIIACNDIIFNIKINLPYKNDRIFIKFVSLKQDKNSIILEGDGRTHPSLTLFLDKNRVILMEGNVYGSSTDFPLSNYGFK